MDGTVGQHGRQQLRHQPDQVAAPKRVPVTKPPVDFAELKRSIPKHCFERSLPRSLAHLGADLAIVTLLFYLSIFIDTHTTGIARCALWLLYWAVQGAFATGVWVIAHECGHGAFSDSQSVNDGFGLVLHSLLLVPYYSWKHSHRRHHKNTGSIDNDEVFVPDVHKPGHTDTPWYWTHPLYRVLYITKILTIGWPAYLVMNASGREYKRWANHFDPSSPIFVNKREGMEVLISDAALLVVVTGLSVLAKLFGTAWLVKTYVMPYLVVNMWLVLITYMQHTHPMLPHYGSAEWDWMRGALATVDRSYGWALDHIFHHITDTHVAHHLFSYMPFYHAKEATKVIREQLGEHYLFDERNVWAALWQDFPRLSGVAPDKAGDQVYWFAH